MISNGHTSIVPLESYATSLAGAPTAKRLDRSGLADWVKEKSDSKHKRRAVSFVLSHDSSEGHGRSVISQFALPKTLSAPEREAAIEKLVDEFDRSSDAYASTYSRMQRFFVGAMCKDDLSEPAESEYPFLVSPPADIAASFHQSESTTSLSAVIGHMQHLMEKSFTLLATNMQADKDRLVEEKRDLMQHYEQIFSQRWEMAVKCEQLLDAHAERQIRVEEARANLEIKAKLYAALANYGFTFLKKYVESKQQSSPEGPILQTLKELDPPELLSIIQVVNALPEAKKEKLAPAIDVVVEAMSDERKLELAKLVHAEMQKRKPEGEP